MPGSRYISRGPSHKTSLVKNMSINRTLTNKTNRYKAAVDHRPTKILVSGYENDEKDLVLSHFRVSIENPCNFYATLNVTRRLLFIFAM